MAVQGSGGGGASAGAIRAGAAFVELSIKDAGFLAGLRAGEARLRKFGAATARIGAGLVGIGGSALGGLAATVPETLGGLSKLGDAAAAFGLTADEASRLFGIMGAAGSDTRDATEGLITFGQRVRDALSGTGEEAAKLFAGLGVQAKEFEGLNPSEQFFKLLDALKQIEDPALRSSLLLKAVGEDTGKNLLSVLNLTPAQLQKIGDAAAVTDADIKAAKESTVAFNVAAASLSSAWRQVAVALAPVVSAVADGLTPGITAAGKFVSQNKELAVAGAAVAAAMVAVGGALIGVGAAANLAAAGVGGLVAVGGAITAAVLSPIGLTVAGLTAVSAAAVLLSDDAAARFGELGQAAGAAFGSIKTTAMDAFGGIRDALTAGDLALAGSIALAGLNLEWKKGLGAMRMAWADFRTDFLTGWNVVTAAAGTIWDTFTTRFAQGLIDIQRRAGGITDADAGERIRGLEGDRRAGEGQRAADAAAETARIKADQARIEADAMARIEQARAEFAAKLAEARKAAEAAEKGRATGPGAGGRGGAATLPRQIAEVRGLFFSRNLQGALGGNSRLAERQAKAAEETAAAVEGSNALLTQLVDKARPLTFA